MNLATLIIALLTTALLAGLGLGWLIAALRYRFKNLGKSLVITLPETPGTFAHAEWAKITDGKIERPSQEHDAQRGDKDSTLPAGAVAYPMTGGLKGPLHILSSYGSNLYCPSKLEAAATIEKEFVADWVANYKRQPKQEEAAKGGIFATGLEAAIESGKKLGLRFRVWDPLRYWKASRENDMQDLYASSGASRDPWYAKAAFFAVIGVIALLLLLFGVISLKVLPALQAANAGA